MPRKPEYPKKISRGACVVRVYRSKATSISGGYEYQVCWVGAEGRAKKGFADEGAALDFAAQRAEQLERGVALGSVVSSRDLIELEDARRIAREGGFSLLQGLEELREARKIAGGPILEAVRAWVGRTSRVTEQVGVRTAVERFIASKNAAGNEGDRVYGSKLKYAVDRFGDRSFGTIDVAGWTAFLEQFSDPVTRNDVRKRVVTLSRWMRRQKLLPDETPAIEQTDRAKEVARKIGILTPEQFAALLKWVRKNRPQDTALLVLAGFCGLRADEIHGKRDHKDRCQMWEDIHLDRGFLSVSAAKENTPANRVVHLCDAAVAYLRLVAKERGPACDHKTGMTLLRRKAKEAGFHLPENCLRHSWITYRIALSGDKQATATEAGNSVKEIDRRYRVPRPRSEGEAWFAIRP